MTTLHARPAGLAWRFPAEKATVPTPLPDPGTIAPLTGIEYTQFGAVSPNLATYHEWWIVAEFRPVGGIGPFRYDFTSPSGYMLVDHDHGLVRTPYGPFPANADHVVNLQITDATGTVVKRSVTLDHSGIDPQLYISGPYARPTNTDFWHMTNPAYPTSPGHTTTDAFSISGSTQFEYNFGAVLPKGSTQGHAANFAAGDYPLTLSSTSATGTLTKGVTLTFKDTPIGPARIAWNVFSDSVPVGFVLGVLQCTTPNNGAGAFTLTGDTSHAVSLNTQTREITAAVPLTAGDFVLTVQVADTGLVASFQFQMHVQAGVRLDPGKMTFAPNPVDNSRLGQVVGTPAVAGIPGGKWFMRQSCYNSLAETGSFANAPPYAQDVASGAVTNTGYLSAQAVIGEPDDVLTFTKTDGITSCTASFSVPVHEAPEKLLWIGAGMAAAHPGVGFDTWAAAGPTLSAAHPGWTYHVMLMGQDYLGDYWWTIGGPIWIEPVAGPDGAFPRMGGPRSNDQVGGFRDGTGKGCLLFGDGDGRVFSPAGVPLEVSCVHGGSSTDGRECIRKEGNSAGNLWLDHVFWHDGDCGLLTGATHTVIKVTNCEAANCGAAHQHAGNLHNIYVGPVRKLILQDSCSHDATQGHLLKSRAMETVLINWRTWEGLNSDAVSEVEFPDYGQITLHNTRLRKGASPFNPYLLNVGAEDPAYLVNAVYADGVTFELMPSSYAACIGNYWRRNAVGEASRITLINARMFLPAVKGAVIAKWETRDWSANPNHPQPDASQEKQPIETGTTMLTIPDALDVSCPWRAGDCAVPGRLFRKFSWGDPRYPNFNHVQQVSDRHEIRVAHGAAAGTVINNIFATGDAAGGPANPFGPGSKAEIIGGPVDRYSITMRPDGACALVFNGATGPGVDLVIVRFTGPTGTLCDNRYPVTVT